MLLIFVEIEFKMDIKKMIFSTFALFYSKQIEFWTISRLKSLGHFYCIELF